MKNEINKIRLDNNILPTICALLNTNGGVINVGVMEKDGQLTIKGCSEGLDNFEKKCNVLISNNIEPAPSPSLFTYGLKYIDGKTIYILTVKEAKDPKYTYEGKIRVRIGNANQTVSSEEDALYCKEVQKENLPQISNYYPDDSDKKAEFKALINNKNVDFRLVGKLTNGSYFFKYMSLEAALLCLEDNDDKKPNIRFVEPSFWDDKFEGRFYNANYKKVDSTGEKSPFLYACCMSMSYENEAAWKIYVDENAGGLASRCVQFRINRYKLREQLAKNLKNCIVYVGPTQYQRESDLDTLHLIDDEEGNKTESYKTFFEPFLFEKYINLLLLKRIRFEHEKEVRFFVIPKDGVSRHKAINKGDKKNEKPLFINLDWADIIDGVFYSPKCSAYEVKLFQQSLNSLAEKKVSDLKLDGDEKDKFLKKFQAKPFDVYADDDRKGEILNIGETYDDWKKRHPDT